MRLAALGTIALGHVRHQAMLQRRQRCFFATTTELAQQPIFDRVAEPKALDKVHDWAKMCNT